MGVAKRKRTSAATTSSARASKKRVKGGGRANAKAKTMRKTASAAKSTAKKVVTESPSKLTAELSSLTEESATTTSTLTNKRRKGREPVRLLPCADMPIARFNLAMDLWSEYSLTQVFDKGVQRENWTSYRLKTNVLLLETARERYELVRLCNELATPPSNLRRTLLPSERIRDTFELYLVLDARNMDDQTIANLPRPLPTDVKELVVGGLDWGDIMWGSQTVQVRDRMLSPTCMCFVPRTAKGNAQQARQITDAALYPPPRASIAASARATTAESTSPRQSIKSPTHSSGSISKQASSSNVVGKLDHSSTPSVQNPVSSPELISYLDDKSLCQRSKPAPLGSTTARAAVSRELQLRRGAGMPLFDGSNSVGLQTS
jgi:hypothetical protein